MAAFHDTSLVPALLVAVAREKRTGVLEILAEGTTTLLYFDGGRVVFAEAGTLSETLGRVLVAEGRLTQEQYAAVIERMTAALVDAEQLRFGETAVAMGFLTGAGVHEALELQVRRKLLRCMQWEEAECRFADHPDALEGITRYPSDVEFLVVEGIRRYWDRARTDVVLAPLLDRWLRLVVSRDVLNDRYRLGADEARFVQKLDGAGTLREALRLGPVDDLRARQILVALLLTEALEIHEHRASAMPSLAPPMRVEVESLRRRADRLAGRIRRAMQDRRAAAAESAAAQSAVAEPITEEQAQLDDKRARLEGERAFQQGRRQMVYGAWPLAAKELRKAAKLCPAMVEYQLYAAWADAQASAAPAERAEELYELCQRALKEDRDLAFGWYVKGRLAMDADDELRALRCFRRATRLDPKDVEAARWHRTLKKRFES